MALSLNSGCGAHTLQPEIENLANLLDRCSGMYELNESTVEKLFWENNLENGLLHNLVKTLSVRQNFPPTFHVGEKQYHREQLSDTQLVAIFLSWLQGKEGEKIYGTKNAIKIIGEGYSQTLTVTGFEDSPELNKAFSEWLEKPSLTEKLHELITTNTIPPEQNQQNNTPIQSSIGLTLHSVISDKYRKFAGEQAKKRAATKKNYATTLSGQALGTTRSRRTETKTLGVGNYRSVHDPTHIKKNTPKNEAKRTRDLPRSLSQILDYTDTVDPVDGGAFEIQRWQTTKGKEAVRVILRGTESWDAGSEQIQDMLTNTEEVAGWISGQQQAVSAALEQMRISKDTPVELFGHSQAGIVAANLAADPQFTRRFKIATVITAGSPVAGAEIPENIPTMHLENTWDPVTKLEAELNHGSPNHVTFMVNMGMPSSITEAHGRPTYLEMAKYLEQGNYAEYVNFMDCRDKALGLKQEILTAEAHRVEVRRTTQ